ncbi:MAG: hypothetical protein H0Z34_13305 [Brevibacillus sp.]|nr:hypothetical protein [Brevibacillus sp.]
METTVLRLSDYRSPRMPQPMSKRTFESGLRAVTKQLEQQQIAAEQGYLQIRRLIDDYFFPEGR